MHPCFLDPEDLLKQCQKKSYRDSGPGGQHRNKVETGVELLHLPTQIVGRASERRSQQDNARIALKRLRLQLALDHREEWESISQIMASRAQGSKIICSPDHTDFPALLSEVLDILHQSDHEPKEVASCLEISLSQLIKFLKKEPRAFQQLNNIRQKNGKHPFK